MLEVMSLVLEVALGPFHRGPEPYVHGTEYDEAPPQGKGVEDPLHHGRQ